MPIRTKSVRLSPRTAPTGRSTRSPSSAPAGRVGGAAVEVVFFQPGGAKGGGVLRGGPDPVGRGRVPARAGERGGHRARQRPARRAVEDGRPAVLGDAAGESIARAP